jgi:hypothetical protein
MAQSCLVDTAHFTRVAEQSLLLAFRVLPRAQGSFPIPTRRRIDLLENGVSGNLPVLNAIGAGGTYRKRDFAGGCEKCVSNLEQRPTTQYDVFSAARISASIV